MSTKELFKRFEFYFLIIMWQCVTLCILKRGKGLPDRSRNMREGGSVASGGPEDDGRPSYLRRRVLPPHRPLSPLEGEGGGGSGFGTGSPLWGQRRHPLAMG